MWWFPELRRIASLAHDVVPPSRPGEAAQTRDLASEVE
jgi:hypothetical protein